MHSDVSGEKCPACGPLRMPAKQQAGTHQYSMRCTCLPQNTPGAPAAGQGTPGGGEMQGVAARGWGERGEPTR
jgi:hypothetical protein